MVSYKKSENNGRVYIHPRFFGVKDKIESDEEASKKDNAMKKTLSYAYSILYSVLYPGRVIRPGDREMLQVMYGLTKDITPDVTDYAPFGTIWTEIKSTSSKEKRPLFTNAQIEKYSYYLLHAMEQGQIYPDSRVAVFCYGKANKKAGLVKLNNDKLRRKIAEETRSLCVFPLNLFLSILRDPEMCKKPIMNHTHSQSPRKEEQYWRVYGRIITRLNNGDLEYFVSSVKKTKRWDRFALENILHLDNLVVENSMSPDNIVFGRHLVRPFSITSYRNKNPEIWLNSFWENHEYILNELELEDIFSMNEEERRLVLREDQVIGEDHNGELMTNGDLEEHEDDLPY